MPDTNPKGQGLKTQIQNEVSDYTYHVVNIAENYYFSAYKLVRRITLFENRVYPNGKFDAQGYYKFWFDIITPRKMAEVKNVDFDTKDIKIYSERKNDDLAVLLANLAMKEWLRETGQEEEINEAIEEGAGWGNVLWEKTGDGYERCDLRNTYVINQTAREVDETPVVQRHVLTQSDLRSKSGVWDAEAIAGSLEDAKQNSYAPTTNAVAKETTVPYYEVYQRDGEVKLSDLKEARGEAAADGDDERFVLARVIVSATRGTAGAAISVKHILYADLLPGKMSDWYKEYHRGPFKGRWWREGITELLFDMQVRANQIGNQLAQGLEWASKTIFYSADTLIVQNIMTDLKNGDILKAKDVKVLETKMQGFAELAAEWNRVMQVADQVSNANAIVMGERLPFGTSFRMADLLNANANKTFDFIREKLAIPLGQIMDEWVVPRLVRKLKAKAILRLTGDPDMLDRVMSMVVDAWYIDNLIAIGPHTEQECDAMKQAKFDELKKRPQLLISGLRALFEEFRPHTQVVITGENSTLPADLMTLQTFIGLEQDPIRRTAMIEQAMRMKGIDVASLPKGGQPVPQVNIQSGGYREQGQGDQQEQEPAPNSPGPLPPSPTSRFARGPVRQNSKVG